MSKKEFDHYVICVDVAKQRNGLFTSESITTSSTDYTSKEDDGFNPPIGACEIPWKAIFASTHGVAARWYAPMPVLLTTIESLYSLQVGIELLGTSGLGDYLIAHPDSLPRLTRVEFDLSGPTADEETPTELDFMMKVFSAHHWPSLMHLRYPADTVYRLSKIENWARAVVGVTSLAIVVQCPWAYDEDISGFLPQNPIPLPKEHSLLSLDLRQTSGYHGLMSHPFFPGLLRSSPDLLRLKWTARPLNLDCKSLTHLELDRDLYCVADLVDTLQLVENGAPNLCSLIMIMTFTSDTILVPQPGADKAIKVAISLFSRLNKLRLVTNLQSSQIGNSYETVLKSILAPAIDHVLKDVYERKQMHRLADLLLQTPNGLDFLPWLQANFHRTQLINNVTEEVLSYWGFQHRSDAIDRNRKHRYVVGQLCVAASFVRANAYHQFQDCISPLVEHIVYSAGLDIDNDWCMGELTYSTIVGSKTVQNYRPPRVVSSSSSSSSSSLIDQALATSRKRKL